MIYFSRYAYFYGYICLHGFFMAIFHQIICLGVHHKTVTVITNNKINSYILAFTCIFDFTIKFHVFLSYLMFRFRLSFF